jgi:hypothetical protein
MIGYKNKKRAHPLNTDKPSIFTGSIYRGMAGESRNEKKQNADYIDGRQQSYRRINRAI